MGITVEQAIRWEIDSLGEAIGNCLGLNDDFLDRYCSEQLKAELQRVPEYDREYVLSGHIGDGEERGYYNCNDDIYIPVWEIELQIESADDLDDPDEWTINGDLAYYPLTAVGFDVDIDSLRDDINEHLAK